MDRGRRMQQPTSTEVVIIGGGIAGVSAALQLTAWGVPVVLCEKGRIAAEQSSRNWGWVRIQGRKAAEIPLMLESMGIWLRLAQEVDTDIGFRRGGVTYLATTETELAERAKWLDHARTFQVETRLLGSREVADIFGEPSTSFVGGVYSPQDAYAEPTLAVPAMARLAAAQGVTMLENTAVRTLEREGGRITGVVTEHGRIACKAVILAGGAWSRTFLENEGFAFPQLAVLSSAQRVTNARHVSPSTFGSAPASIRPRLDGDYTLGRATAARFDLIPAAFTHFRAFLPVLRARWKIMKLRLGPQFFGPLGRHRWRADEVSPFEQVRTLDPKPEASILDDTLAAARRLYPHMADIRVVQRWASMIDVMPDEVPVIDEMPGLPGLVVATGLSGHGFGLGPGIGMMAAEIATGRPTTTSRKEFRFDRF